MTEKKFSIRKIAGIIGADATGLREAFISSFITDSRQLDADENSLFFAISTKGNDGHKFIADLYRRKGVRAFVVREKPEAFEGIEECDFLCVPCPVAALQLLAAERRKAFGGCMLSITGSVGKTTVKEWLFQLLEPLKKVTRSPRSFNSQIGVPLSLLAMDEDADVALVEAGISRHGEMEAIERMVCPDLVVVTNVLADADDSFSSLREKAMQMTLLAMRAGVVVYDADDAVVAEAVNLLPEGKLLLGVSRSDADAPVYIESIETSENGSAIHYLFRGNRETAHVPLTGDADIADATLVIATMLAMGVEPALIDYRLRTVRPISTRINVSDGVNGCLLIYDSFTCDVESLRSALDFMHRRVGVDSRRRTLILSDMPFESSEATARTIASLTEAAGITRMICVGQTLEQFRAHFPADTLFFASTDSLMQTLSTSDFSYELILIKGAAEFHFGRLLRNLEARTHETVLEVNLDSIVKNYNYFRSALNPSTGIVAMVKASGYGAGSYEIAKTLQSQGAAYLAVAVLDEGIDLRHAGISMPIMVMNPKVVNYKAMFEHRLEPEIYSFEMLRDVVREARKYGVQGYPVHLKLDTGMHRMGFEPDTLDDVIEFLNSQHHVVVSTVFSHLATADCPDMDDYTLQQLSLFASATDRIKTLYPHPFRRHILNSAGILRFPQYQYDLVRLGIGLYGANTLPPEMEKPLAVVSTLRTVVISVKERRDGDTIGYARRGVCRGNRRIATIPIGYADGMNRRFGNGASRVWINGRRVPTIGNICMDACMIDVTGVPCEVGDTVEIFGPNIPVGELADILGTIPYEVLTSVSPRVKRIYYRE